jgi:hypothetical protein
MIWPKNNLTLLSFKCSTQLYFLYLLFVFSVLSPGGELLFPACWNLDGARTGAAARHVLERHARVPQVRVLEGDHLQENPQYKEKSSDMRVSCECVQAALIVSQLVH